MLKEGDLDNAIDKFLVALGTHKNRDLMDIFAGWGEALWRKGKRNESLILLQWAYKYEKQSEPYDRVTFHRMFHELFDMEASKLDVPWDVIPTCDRLSREPELTWQTAIPP